MNPKRLEQELRMQSRVVRELAGELQRARCECDRLEAIGASHEQWQKACEVAATLAEKYVRAEIELRRLESKKGAAEAEVEVDAEVKAAAGAAVLVPVPGAVVPRVSQARDGLSVTQDNASEEEEEEDEEEEGGAEDDDSEDDIDADDIDADGDDDTNFDIDPDSDITE